MLSTVYQSYKVPIYQCKNFSAIYIKDYINCIKLLVPFFIQFSYIYPGFRPQIIDIIIGQVHINNKL